MPNNEIELTQCARSSFRTRYADFGEYNLTRVRQFRKLLIFSGLFNIILAFPLIIPNLYRYYIDLIYHLNEALTLGGVKPDIQDDGLSQLLINTAGIDLVLIGSIVLVAAIDPIKFRLIPLLNAVGRTLFAAIVVYYVVSYDIIRFVLLLGAIDVLISMGFIYFLVITRKDYTV